MIDEYNARQSNPSTSTRSGKGHSRHSWNGNGFNANKRSDNSSDNSDSDGTDHNDPKALAMALKALNASKSDFSSFYCEFCEQEGHTEDKCFQNPENPNNKLSAKARKLYVSVVFKHKQDGKKPKAEFAGAVIAFNNESVFKTTIVPPKLDGSFADSGATAQCFHSMACFMPASLRPASHTVQFADKSLVMSTYAGDVILPFENAKFRLQSVLLVPEIEYNLVALGQLEDNGIKSLFDRNKIELVAEKNAFVIGSGTRDCESRLYVFPDPIKHKVSTKTLSALSYSLDLWHRGLAHINPRDLGSVHKYADDVPKLAKRKDVCRACKLEKEHKLPILGHFEVAERVGDIVHSDIVGKIETSFPDQYRYASTFLDKHSRYTFVGLMRHSSDIHEIFKGVQAKFQKIGGASMNKVHSDGAKEYLALQDSLGGREEKKSFSPPYTPELNGIAERVSRTMVEGALAMLIQANLPSCLWPFALKHAIHVRNRVPHSATAKTPHLVSTGKQSSLKHIRVFGCAAYVLRQLEGSKSESWAIEGVHSETLEHGVYRVLITDENGIPKVTESLHVTFDESKFPGAPDLEDYVENESDSDERFVGEPDESESDNESEVHVNVKDDDDYGVTEQDQDVPDTNDTNGNISDDNNGDDGDDDEAPLFEESGDEDSDDCDNDDEFQDAQDEAPEPQRQYPVRTKRGKKPFKWYKAMSARSMDQLTITTSDAPTLSEALNATPKEGELWEAAIDDEMKSPDSNSTWVPDDSPESQPLPTRAILKIKRNADGSVERFNARVVAGGNHQAYSETYKETYTPVVSFKIVPLLLYLTLCLGMSIGQVDVKTAFLNGELSESVCVMSPRGIPGVVSMFYRILKAIYGLKRSHLACNTKLEEISMVFDSSSS